MVKWIGSLMECTWVVSLSQKELFLEDCANKNTFNTLSTHKDQNLTLLVDLDFLIWHQNGLSSLWTLKPFERFELLNMKLFDAIAFFWKPYTWLKVFLTLHPLDVWIWLWHLDRKMDPKALSNSSTRKPLELKILKPLWNEIMVSPNVWISRHEIFLLWRRHKLKNMGEM